VSNSKLALDMSAVRADQIRSTLIEIFSGITGIAASEFVGDSSFMELGLDSLSLLQASQLIHRQLGVKVPFRSLFDELSTIDVLAANLASKATTPSVKESAVSVPPAQSSQTPAQPSDFNALAAALEKARTHANGAGPHVLEGIARQLAMLSQQLAQFCEDTNTPSREKPARVANGPAAISAWPASAPVQLASGAPGALNERQREHLNHLIARLTTKTAESKRRAQASRGVLADSVVSANFRLPWKEICYPIIVQRAEGATAWDIDGNQYVDAAMGFGSLVFGHSPAFIREALSAQYDRGMRLGFQSDLAGEVAGLISELTGVERVAFCNSGTEAVMTALRLARAVTGRNKIALFSGVFHGTFDGVLAGSMRDSNGILHTTPRVNGVPPKMVEDVLVLPFGEHESIDILSRHAHELAAVLIEPAPWWGPDIDLKWFLRQLRSITEPAGAALVFDEVVFGFRMHPGGAQAMYGVRADLVTYGKALGSGMPIGVIAGDARYLDAIDGGQWSFGDASSPQVDTTLFAGTFFKHPMVMAVAHAVLQHLRQSGPQLQEQLNARTAAMAADLNSYFASRELPIRVVQFGSGFSFGFSCERTYADLFFHYLLDQGMYVCDTRKCYLSTAHTDQDINKIIDAIKRSAESMREGGFLLSARQAQSQPVSSNNAATQSAPISQLSAGLPGTGSIPSAPQSFPITSAQKGLWALSYLSPEACRAYNESINISLRGHLDVAALRASLSELVQRHDALRTTFSADGAMQQITPELDVHLPVVDLSSTEGAARMIEVDRWLTQDVNEAFDLERGPLFRLRLLKLKEEHHVLAVVIHHIVVDGWSIEILLRELGALYSANTLGIDANLPPPVSFSAYASGQPGNSSNGQPTTTWDEEDEAYWLSCYRDGVPVVKFPTVRPRPPIQTYNGAHLSRVTDSNLYRQVKSLGDLAGCTPFTVLLAVFQIVLRDITGQDETVVGVHLAGQSMLPNADVCGYCIEMLPLRGKARENASFQAHLAQVKASLADAVQHHGFSVSQLVKKLKLQRDPSRPPLVTVVFNMDPPAAALTSKLAGVAVLPWWDLACELVPNPKVFARFDQVWSLVEQDGSLVIQCTYNTDLFEASTIQSALKHFERLAAFYAAAPGSLLKRNLTGKHPGERGPQKESARPANRTRKRAEAARNRNAH
jgi:glutamate-1-semialdehyde aminotransferase/acyl carrier protein